jgi:hypothetical protein
LTTAAHSTGIVMPASRFQLASMAARSIVSTPPVIAAAGKAGVLVGCRVGSTRDMTWLWPARRRQ